MRMPPPREILTLLCGLLFAGAAHAQPFLVCDGRNHARTTANPFTLTAGTRLAVFFQPTAPLNVERIEWFFTLPANASAASGTAELRTHDPVNNVPTNTVLGSTTFCCPGLLTMLLGPHWHGGSLPAPVPLAADTPYWVTYVLSSTTGWDSMGVENLPPGPDQTIYALETGGVWGPAQVDRFKVRLLSRACAPVSLTLGGAPVVGTTVPVWLSSPADPSRPYACGFSSGTDGIPLPDGRRIPLSLDPLLFFSLTPGNPHFLDTMGILEANGAATVTMVIPPAPVLVGVTIHAAFVALNTLAPSGIGSISPSHRITFQ